MTVQTDRLGGPTGDQAVKAPCVVATSANITLSGLQTINGVTVAQDDRVLVMAQTNTVNNGIYNASTSAWTRATDFDGNRDVVQGTLVVVVSASGVGTVYRVTTANPVVIGTSNIAFATAIFGDSSSVNFLQAGTGAVSRTSQDKMRDFVNAKDFGAVGDGTTDNTTFLQAALNSLTSGGTLYIPAGTYRSKMLRPLANTTILLDGGATLKAMASANNELFLFQNSPGTTTNMSASSGTSLTVTSSTGFAAGDRIIISAGTFTGSGVEEGPLEFNTVSAVPDGTHLTLKAAVKYNYAGWGLAGAAPHVIRLGVETAIVKNIRVTGGTISPDTTSSFNSIYFNFQNVENIEIDHIIFQDFGNGLSTGHNLSRLNLHDCIWTGTSIGGGSAQGFGIASMVESKIQRNLFVSAYETTNSGTGANHCVLEVTCRDNIISDNVFGPIRDPSGAAIEISFYGFGNTIINNRIVGADADVAGGTTTLGVRTYANGGNVGPGNIICGNLITNIMLAIGDSQANSVIHGNTHKNDTLHANSATVYLGAENMITPALGNNSSNITRAISVNGVTGGMILFSGSTAPPDVSGPGSWYLQKGSTTPGGAFQTRQATTTAGTYAWYAVNQMPSIAFASASTAYANGTMLYITDGTTGSDPLSGGGSGTAAIRMQNKWVAFPAST